ncbi:MAG: ring finger protein HAC1 [Pirellulaceae bacterium]|nr:MAG: ring finger protein HAC1 [Pirellulaceae bacterium]
MGKKRSWHPPTLGNFGTLFERFAMSSAIALHRLATPLLGGNRRRWCRYIFQGACGWALAATAGCVEHGGGGRVPDLVWGRRGLADGRLLKPRAIAISPGDELYIVDMTGRIQVFDTDGNFLRGWRTPEIKQGKPTGLAWSNDGDHLLVADTHYFRVLVYQPDGTLVEQKTIGGTHGDAPGEFHFVTDVTQDHRGHFFVGQYGQIDQIQEFAPDGQFLRRWGNQGSNPGDFSRPQSLIVDAHGWLWVADACNHRIQVFDPSQDPPVLVSLWGAPGAAAGQLQYPYGIEWDHDGTLLVIEYGNHRVQRFDREGRHLEMWGGPGTEPGQFRSPWALGLDSQRRLHVLDSMNHRVQRYAL